VTGQAVPHRDRFDSFIDDLSIKDNDASDGSVVLAEGDPGQFKAASHEDFMVSHRFAGGIHWSFSSERIP
jgi:hypothetical protein